ncbi:aminoacyl-tRNA hydrolase [Tengunoibacter tsumagoiensis]|uniref:Peptidyl-tRNA hydrolase n=1 Tax=Tengunoibacter tsumagoiensis TaxID=2014871 RepID=A0A401ZYA8_9CHLR|nr:aminoacyl-tRNA hydrolase [Tengunoibacter tsumagoiensis]GCE11827.1 peptidyl-tRNA hydrolase [Tengunoibacter tsumagoiensis]
MKLIIGLGNPGSEYERTRHNAGFRIVDELAKRHGWRWERNGRAMIANGHLGTEKVVLVKPITFMNKSGEAVGELLRWYKVQPEDALVIYDDLDLPVGKIRVRRSGSAGGHNGIKSIISHLHTNTFPHLRVGIGRPANPKFQTVDYVLGAPGGDEQIQLELGESAAVDAIPLILEQGIDAAMNILNVDPEAKKKAEERRRQQQERREQEKLRKAAENEKSAEVDSTPA